MAKKFDAQKFSLPNSLLNGKLTTTFDIQRFSDTDKIKLMLQTFMQENNIRGKVVYPSPKIDFSTFKFDAAHTQGDEHSHDVTEEEARRFIEEAYFVIVKYNGNSYNYYGKNGATFVRNDLGTLRTSFKSEEYDDKIRRLIEVYENAVGSQ